MICEYKRRLIKTPEFKLNLDEDRRKFLAQIALADISASISVPDEETWIGVGLLERDDLLKRSKT